MVIHSSLLHWLDAVSWEIHSFSIPLITGGCRNGFVVRIETDEGEVKWGEVAPLPGRSQESLETALQQLLEYFKTGKRDGLTPSVQFGLESLFETAKFPIKASTYAFLNGSIESIIEQAEMAKRVGYTTVKIKVGSLPIKEAQMLIGLLGQQFRLRVDCNSAFSFQEALALFKPFDPSVFDYIEDPTHELQYLPQFTHPFALDETADQYQKLPLPSYEKLYGFILKPTILGGKKGCLPLVEYAKKHQLKVVLSPSFETGLGLLQILKLGQELDVLDELIGLDTHRALAYDLLSNPVYFNTPEITVVEEAGVDINCLKRIDHGTTTLSPLSTSNRFS